MTFVICGLRCICVASVVCIWREFYNTCFSISDASNRNHVKGLVNVKIDKKKLVINSGGFVKARQIVVLMKVIKLSCKTPFKA